MIKYKTRNTCNLLERQGQRKASNTHAGRGAATSVGLCVSASGSGLRCRSLMENENTWCRPWVEADENEMANFELRSRCRRAEGWKTGCYSDPEWMLGKWAESKKLGWSNISIHGKYQKIEIYFLTRNNFYIVGTTNCFSIKNYSVMCDTLTPS